MLNSNQVFEVIIIGAGPAGLSVGYSLSKLNRKVLVLDSGKPFEQRSDDRFDVCKGVGGCGLFSDGKLSYSPSASNLWKIGQHDEVKDAYLSVKDLFSKVNISIKDFDSNSSAGNNNGQKYYDSDVLGVYDRKNLLSHMIEVLGDNIRPNATVQKVSKRIDNKYLISCSGDIFFICDFVVYAAGRYGSKNFQDIFGAEYPLCFVRYEVGLRIEFPSSQYKPYSNPQIDYKIIKQVDDVTEVRTFCNCKDGRVIEGQYDNIVSYNGSQSKKKTNKSNVGIDIRVTDDKKDTVLLKEIKKIIDGQVPTFTISLENYMNSKSYLGLYADKIIRDFIIETFGDYCRSKDALVYGPTIEGLGRYPQISLRDLRIQEENVWICGDSCGFFRGLLAAFVSGFFVAKQIDNHINDLVQPQISIAISQLAITTSPTTELPLVYTAQSKVFYYCRDVVCQHVFTHDKVPLNPFRVFGYFLGDRIERENIRRGNNQLIRISNEVWVFGPISNGVLAEIALAKSLNKPIRFFSIGTRVEEIFELQPENIVFEPEVHKMHIEKEKLIQFLIGENISIYNQLNFFSD
jgi:hypothetical protein